MDAALKIGHVDIEPAGVFGLFVKKSGILLDEGVFGVLKGKAAVVFLELLVCLFGVNDLGICPGLWSKDRLFASCGKKNKGQEKKQFLHNQFNG
jgi:hypothetical protein